MCGGETLGYLFTQTRYVFQIPEVWMDLQCGLLVWFSRHQLCIPKQISRYTPFFFFFDTNSTTSYPLFCLLSFPLNKTSCRLFHIRTQTRLLILVDDCIVFHCRALPSFIQPVLSCCMPSYLLLFYQNATCCWEQPSREVLPSRVRIDKFLAVEWLS